MGWGGTYGPTSYATTGPDNPAYYFVQQLQDAARSSKPLRDLLASAGWGDDAGSSQAASYSQYPGALGWGPTLQTMTGMQDSGAATQEAIGKWSSALGDVFYGGLADKLPGGLTAYAQSLRGKAGEGRGPVLDAGVQQAMTSMIGAWQQYLMDPAISGAKGLMGAHQAAWLQQQSNNQALKNTLLTAVLRAALNNQTVSWNSGLAANTPPAQSPTSGGGGGGSGGSGPQTPGLYEQMITAQKQQEKENSLAAYMQNLGMAYSGLPKSSTYGGMRDTSGMYNNVQDYSGYA